MSAVAVEIGHGGIVSVDPDDLRGFGARISSASVDVQLAQQELVMVPGLVADARIGEVSWVWALSKRIEEADAALDALASAVGTMADAYELAELRARLAMLGAGDPALAQTAERRIDELLRADPRLAGAEEKLRAAWQQSVAEGFTPAGPAPWWGDGPGMAALYLAAPLLFAGVSVVRGEAQGIVGSAEWLLRQAASRHGVVDPRPLRPGSGAVVVDSSNRPGGAAPATLRPGDVVLRAGESAVLRAGSGVPGSAPASLSQAVARVPVGTQPQVRVEKYSFEDGSTRFVAYVDGTRSSSLDGSDPEPWDMSSNTAAYLDHAESDSYRATVAALKDAGADASTPVDLVGYSQGGMITDLIAQSGEFDVRGVFTVGSPIEPALPVDVLDVAVRHTDDPVAGLAGGGSPGGTGSPDSLVITRTVAPGHGIDPGLPAHQFAAYRETVRQAEASGDVRMDAIHDHFAALQGATMTSTDYTATREVPEK